MDIADDRHFSNPWRLQQHVDYESDQNWAQKIAAKLVELVNILSTECVDLSSSDVSVYTGLAGIGLFYQRLSQVDAQLIGESMKSHALQVAQKLTCRCLRHLDVARFRKNVSLFTSSIGPLLLGSLVHTPPEASSLNREQCLAQILAASKFATSPDSNMPDEALYGRAGYLNALLILKTAGFEVPDADVAEVTNAIIQSGLNTAKRYHKEGLYSDLVCRSSRSNLPMPPLMYEWHEKTYLGGAHGFAGILLTLIKTHKYFPDAVRTNHLKDFIWPTVHWLAELQLSSGNWPSSLGESMDRDVLVHWCHGATGVVPLMLAAYQLTGDDSYLKRAVRGGEAIWIRGLLFKGCGLCHGSAGSGYALLDLYRVTNDQKYLWQARKFAEWCTDCFKNRKRVADRPYSLFEGLAGTLYFLTEILDPSTARFPLVNAG